MEFFHILKHLKCIWLFKKKNIFLSHEKLIFWRYMICVLQWLHVVVWYLTWWGRPGRQVWLGKCGTYCTTSAMGNGTTNSEAKFLFSRCWGRSAVESHTLSWCWSATSMGPPLIAMNWQDYSLSSPPQAKWLYHTKTNAEGMTALVSLVKKRHLLKRCQHSGGGW